MIHLNRNFIGEYKVRFIFIYKFQTSIPTCYPPELMPPLPSQKSRLFSFLRLACNPTIICLPTTPLAVWRSRLCICVFSRRQLWAGLLPAPAAPGARGGEASQASAVRAEAEHREPAAAAAPSPARRDSRPLPHGALLTSVLQTALPWGDWKRYWQWIILHYHHCPSFVFAFT